MSSIDNKIQEFTKQAYEHHQLLKLREKLPDLDIHTNRWGHQHYVSDLIIKDCNDYLSGRDCGCCVDSPHYIMPYINMDGFKVYTKKYRFYIGENDYSYIFQAVEPEKLEKELKDYGFNNDFVKKIVDIQTIHVKEAEEAEDCWDDDDEL